MDSTKQKSYGTSIENVYSWFFKVQMTIFCSCIQRFVLSRIMHQTFLIYAVFPTQHFLFFTIIRRNLASTPILPLKYGLIIYMAESTHVPAADHNVHKKLHRRCEEGDGKRQLYEICVFIYDGITNYYQIHVCGAKLCTDRCFENAFYT